MFNDQIKIIVIEEDYSSMKYSFMCFAKILTGKTTKEILSKEYGILEGEGFYIQIVKKNYSSRGMRCDYVINNTQDKDFHFECVTPMMGMSKFLKEFKGIGI
jgi:hypothetical protein